MISTEPEWTTRRYPTGPVPCEKIVFPAGKLSVSVTAATRASSSAPTASNGGCAARNPAMSSIGPGSGLLALGGDPGGLTVGAVLGQDRGRAAAQRDEVVDDSDAAEDPDEDERSPLVVPLVIAVDLGARPRQVDHDNRLEDDGQYVHRQPPAPQREVGAVVGRRPLAAEPGDQQRHGDAHVGDVEHDDRDRGEHEERALVAYVQHQQRDGEDAD